MAVEITPSCRVTQWRPGLARKGDDGTSEESTGDGAAAQIIDSTNRWRRVSFVARNWTSDCMLVWLDPGTFIQTADEFMEVVDDKTADSTFFRNEETKKW
jgi:hypothetical protein